MNSLIDDTLGSKGSLTLENERNQDVSLQVTLADRINEIYRVCCNTNSMVGVLRGELSVMSSRISALEEQIQQLKNTTGRTEALLGLVTHADEDLTSPVHTNDAQVTRKVSNAAPAAVI